MSINLGMIKFLLSILLSFFCENPKSQNAYKEREKKKQASSSKEILKRKSKKKQNFNEMKSTR